MYVKRSNYSKITMKMYYIVLVCALATSGAVISGASPTTGMVWDGNDPFHQPFATTNYYGSGDVNNDGTVNSSDAAIAQQIVNGTEAFTMRADVNGDGSVTPADVTLINGAVTSGQVLPAWWDKLTTRQARNNWVDKMLALDSINSHVYNYYYQCVNYAAQLYLHATGCRLPLRTSIYDGGQTIFNMPMYFLNIVGTHSANAILVGDNPLVFSDWRIIEPQNDQPIKPGDALMQYGSELYFDSLPCIYLGSGVATETLVEFNISNTGAVNLVSQRPGIVLSRTAPINITPNNSIDCAMPRIIDNGNGYLLFEKLRDDVSASTDIHMSQLPFSSTAHASPLVKNIYYSRLLDTCKDSNGTIHILWSQQTGGTINPDTNVSIMYGTLDASGKTINNKSTIAAYTWTTFTGRILVTGSGEINAFWIDRSADSKGDLFWSKKNGAVWSSPVDLAPDLAYIENSDHDSAFPYSLTSFSNYIFDVIVTASNRILLCWYDVSDIDGVCTLIDRRYNGSSWSAENKILQIASEPAIRGLDMAADSNGNMAHLVYWTGYRSYSATGRGRLLYRNFNNLGWSSETVIEDSENNSCPSLAAGNNGKIFMVWSYLLNGNSIPAWSTCDSGSWGNVELLPVSSGHGSSYPTVACISGTNKLAFAWCASSSSVNTIETIEVPINGDIHTGDVNGSGSVDIVDALLIAQYYVGLNPANFNKAVADVNCDTRVDIVDALLIAQLYVGLIPELPCQ
jgi:hypothetical protein